MPRKHGQWVIRVSNVYSERYITEPFNFQEGSFFDLSSSSKGRTQMSDPIKPVKIVNYEDLTIEQAKQVGRLLGEDSNPYQYQYAVQSDKVVLAKTPKEGGNDA